MKGQSEKTKVVVRHLPPTISQVTFMEQIDVAFAGRYNWVWFRPGKNRLGFFLTWFESLSDFVIGLFLPLLACLRWICFILFHHLIWYMHGGVIGFQVGLSSGLELW